MAIKDAPVAGGKKKSSGGGLKTANGPGSTKKRSGGGGGSSGGKKSNYGRMRSAYVNKGKQGDRSSRGKRKGKK